MKHASVWLLFALAACSRAQNVATFDPQLRVSTLVREDLFAGFLTNDMQRLAVAEKNLEVLLQERPKAKPEIMAWQAGAALFHATLAHEQGQPAEFDRQYKRTADLFEQAGTAAPGNEGVAAITGGTYILFMDRLPEKHRAAAAGKAYAAYQTLVTKQGPILDKLPIHHRGEVLSGLAQSAQRSGRKEETAQYLDNIIAMLPNTPYEARARKWKESPEMASRTTIACLTCHDSGKLATTRAALAAQPK
jgi:hypothetical protein